MSNDAVGMALYKKNYYYYYYLRPPRFLRAGSIGAGNGLTVFTGGGSSHFSIFPSMSARNESPILPLADSWKLSTRAARVHLAATRREVFRLMSWRKHRRIITRPWLRKRKSLTLSWPQRLRMPDPLSWP